MDWSSLLPQIVEVCIIPLLGVLTVFLVNFIRMKMAELRQKNDNALFDKYMTLLENTVVDCVITTNQTYTDELKKNGAFTVEAQKEAFRRTYEAIMGVLSKDAVKYLENAVGDLKLLITQKIEAEVSVNKKELKPAE